MKRSKFLKVLGLGAVGAIVATKVVIEATKQTVPQYHIAETQAIVNGKHITVGPGWLSQIEERGKITLYTDINGKEQFENVYRAYYEEYIENGTKAWKEYKKGDMSQRYKKSSKFF